MIQITPCDIETDIEFVCDDDNNLFIDVIISGDGDYEILDFSTFEFQSGPAGTYTFGPIENDFMVSI